MPNPTDPTSQLPPGELASDQLDAATTVAPALVHSPATAVTVASSGGDIEQSGQSVSHAQHLSAIAHSVQDRQQGGSGGGFWGAISSLGHDVGHVAADVGGGLLKVLNYPMQVAQHSFRYLVATEQKDGWGAAIGEGLAMLAGAAAVGALTGGFGDLGLAGLGAEGAEEAGSGISFANSLSKAGQIAARAGEDVSRYRGVAKAFMTANKAERSGFFVGGQLGGLATGQVMNKDLWDKTGSAKWVDEHGNQVSFGRVVAGMLGLKSGYRTVVSGSLDGIFDLANGNLPGVQEIGAARGIEGGTGVFSKLGGYAWNTDQLDKVIENPALYGPAHRAAQMIADSESPTHIAQLFPALNAEGVGVDEADQAAAEEYQKTFLEKLADAKTKDEVFQVMRVYTHATDLLNGTRLPTMSIFRLPLNRLRTAAEQAEPKIEQAVRGGAGDIPFKGTRRALAPIAASLSPATWARRLTHLPGMELDPNTLHAYNRTVDFVRNRVPTELVNVLKVTQGADYAEAFGNLWLHADPRTREVMNWKGQLSAIFGMVGHKLPVGSYADMETIADPETQSYLAQRMEQLQGAFQPDAADRYGAYRSGKALQPAVDEDGRKIGAGVLLSQHGKGTIMSMPELRRTAETLRSGKDLYGSFDDWMYRNATGPLFKKWVLLSAGYMSRISAAENVPNALRNGVGNMVRGAVAYAREHYGWEVDQDPESLNRLEKAVYGLIGHVPLSPERVQSAAEVTLMGNGPGLPNSVLAGHGAAGIEDPTERVESGIRSRAAAAKQVEFGKNYQMYGQHDRWHLRQWRIWLNSLKRDPMSTDAAKELVRVYEHHGTETEATLAAERAWKRSLASLPDDLKSSYIASGLKRADDPPAWSPEDSWAYHGVQNLIAATHTPEDVADAGPHMDLLRAVADPDARLPKLRDMNQIEEDRRPLAVPGREVLQSGDGRLSRISTTGFKFMNHFVNLTSRYSLFENEYFKQRMALLPDMEKGIINHEHMMTLAYSRATQEATKWIHNLHDRTMWTETMRNWAPFWFAKEQAYRRMGRLLAADPAAFRNYELMIMGVHNLTVKQQDQTGNPYVVFPGEGFLTDSVLTPLAHLGLPIGKINPVELGGNFNDLSVVFPTSGLAAQGQGMLGIGPDFGPVAVVPAKLLYGAISAEGRRYTGFAKPVGQIQGLANAVFGQQALSESFVNDVLPNTALQRMFSAISANDNTFDSAMMLTIQTMDYDQNVAMQKWIAGGRKGPMPDIVPPLNAGYAQKQAFLARVKNMTQMNLIARALLSVATPVTLEMQYANFGLPTELQNDITAAGSVTAGMTRFLQKNPNATPYTVSESTHPGSLAALPESAQGQAWVEQNSQLINEFPEAAVWLMPQSFSKDPYSQTAYNEQIADNLRVKDTPQQFLDALYTAAGDQTYYAAYAEHRAALLASGSNTSAANAEYGKWDQYIQQLQIQMPTWFANSSLFSANKQAEEQQTITQLQTIYGSNRAPAGQQSQLVKQLLDSYNVAAQQFAAANTQYNYASAVKGVREAWSSYLAEMKAAYPQLQPIISSVFSGIFYITQ